MTRFLALALPLALCSGCFLVASTDDFVEDEGCDLELDVRAFAPHIGQTFEVRLVQGPPESIDESRPRLLVLGIFDPLENPNMDLQFPDAVPALTDATRPRPVLDFYADFDMDGRYTMPPSDHTWRVEDPCAPDRDPEFPHNVDFFDLPMPIGGGSDVFVDFCPNLTTGDRIDILEPFPEDSTLEVRVTGTFLPTVDGMTEEDRPVGFYRLENASTARSRIRIPAVFDNGFRYRIEIIVDRNDNFAYEGDVDHAWTYIFNPASAPDCEPFDPDNPAPVCGPRAMEVPACKDGPDIRVRLSRAHVPNFGSPVDTRWVEVPEGT